MFSLPGGVFGLLVAERDASQHDENRARQDERARPFADEHDGERGGEQRRQRDERHGARDAQIGDAQVQEHARHGRPREARQREEEKRRRTPPFGLPVIPGDGDHHGQGAEHADENARERVGVLAALSDEHAEGGEDHGGGHGVGCGDELGVHPVLGAVGLLGKSCAAISAAFNLQAARVLGKWGAGEGMRLCSPWIRTCASDCLSPFVVILANAGIQADEKAHRFWIPDQTIPG